MEIIFEGSLAAGRLDDQKRPEFVKGREVGELQRRSTQDSRVALCLRKGVESYLRLLDGFR